MRTGWHELVNSTQLLHLEIAATIKFKRLVSKNVY